MDTAAVSDADNQARLAAKAWLGHIKPAEGTDPKRVRVVEGGILMVLNSGCYLSVFVEEAKAARANHPNLFPKDLDQVVWAFARDGLPVGSPSGRLAHGETLPRDDVILVVMLSSGDGEHAAWPEAAAVMDLAVNLRLAGYRPHFGLH